MRSLIRKTRNLIKNEWLKHKISKKWNHDCQYLPLTSEHHELYEIIHRIFWRKLGEFPDLVDCRDFNDNIQWLKLFDQSHEIIRCSDKVLVRDYVRERVGDKYLIELYQVHNHFDQINFDLLPKSFVIKTNHDSGTVILVRDKSKLDIESAKNKIDSSLRRPYGWLNGEWAYSYIEPKVLVEGFIAKDQVVPPADYKFYCVNGTVKFCHYIYDRGTDTKEQTIDIDGNDLKTDLYPSFSYGSNFKKPKTWDEMLEVAKKVGQNFKCVRVDMFCSKNKIYVGEMTFWPMAGHYKGQGQKKLGQYLDFDRTTYKPCILPELEKKRSRFSTWIR